MAHLIHVTLSMRHVIMNFNGHNCYDHPGEHLAEILDELGISQYRLAKTIGVPRYVSTKSSTAADRLQRTRRCESDGPWG